MLLSVIVPCYNEEENVPIFYEETSARFGNIATAIIAVSASIEMKSPVFFERYGSPARIISP